MQQPKVKVNGKEFEVFSLNWSLGDISHVSYFDIDEIRMAFYNPYSHDWTDEKSNILDVELIRQEELQHV